MILYHISYDAWQPLCKTFIPRIPESAIDVEDKTIPRICFAPSIEKAISAVGCRFESDDELYVYELDTNQIPWTKLMTPEELQEKQLVPDVQDTDEYWVLMPVELCAIKYKVKTITWYRPVEQKSGIYTPMYVTDLTLEPVEGDRNG